MTALGFGFSPCPNDTFAFHALVHGIVGDRDLRVRPVLADIEELNRRAAGTDPLAVTKLSIGALAGLTGRYAVLPAGAALGRGVGPLVVVRGGGDGPQSLADLVGRRVAVPGRGTTAFLLLRSFAPASFVPVEMRFDRILDAVSAGEVDAGLVIHEGRFTYAARGLEKLADLGELWESDTGAPLPLGVIAARRDLPRTVFDALARGLRASVEHAFANPADSRSFVREHAQELSDDVCARHIELYVNEFSVELGDVGRAAIDTLIGRSRAAGLLPDGREPWP